VKSLPYENATTGKAAVEEMRKLLVGFGASSFGVMEDFQQGVVIVQFVWRDRPVTISASSKGYAAAWLRYHPFNAVRSRGTRADHEAKALKQAQVSVYSILRDWLKGQITAVEVGLLTFEGAFLGMLMLPTGETVLARLERGDMLQLPGPATPR
jgi:hypothetical protein